MLDAWKRGYRATGWLSSRSWLAPIDLISAMSQPDHAPYLFLDIAFVSQLGYCDARERRINRLFGQSNELAGILLIALGEGNEQLGLERRVLHLIISRS